MAYRIWIEGSGAFPIVRADPLDPPEQRSGHRGPFDRDRELLTQVAATACARCYANGVAEPRGRLVNTWHFQTQATRRDAQIITAALTSFLQDGDDQALHAYVRSPPAMRARPAIGESWAA